MQISLDFNLPTIKLKETVLREISKVEGKSFIVQHHNVHSTLACHLYLGLFFDNQLLGVTAFNHGPFPNFGKLMSKGLYGNKDVWSLHRLCCSDIAPKYSESVLISRCAKHIKRDYPKIKLLVTYVAASHGEIGTAWQATNWIYIGTTLARSGNTLHRYLFSLGSHKEKEQILERWRPELKPYPKRSQGDAGICVF